MGIQEILVAERMATETMNRKLTMEAQGGVVCGLMDVLQSRTGPDL